MMLTDPTWLSDALLTLSTVPPLADAVEIEKHRLPLTVTASPPRLPDVMHNWGELDVDATSVMVPPRPVPLSVLPASDSEAWLNAMLVDGEHWPEVWASVRERFAKKVNADDPGEKVRVVGPERPSLHKVEKMLEHDVAVVEVPAKIEGPKDPAGAASGEDAPDPPAVALPVPGATDVETGPDAAKSLLLAGM